MNGFEKLEEKKIAKIIHEKTHIHLFDLQFLVGAHELLMFILNSFSNWLHSNVCVTQRSTNYMNLIFNFCVIYILHTYIICKIF